MKNQSLATEGEVAAIISSITTTDCESWDTLVSSGIK